MKKSVSLTVAPPRITAAVEDWVTSRHGHDGVPEAANEAPLPPPEPTVRLTFDVPKTLHKRLKRGAMDREETIADVIRALITKEFPAP